MRRLSLILLSSVALADLPGNPEPRTLPSPILGGSAYTSADAWGGDVFTILPIPAASQLLGLPANSLLQLEPHLGWQDNNTTWSLGLVYRQIITGLPEVRSHLTGDINWLNEGLYFGGNLFLDGTQSNRNLYHWAVSAGAEVGTRYVMLHANYYLPLTNEQRYGTRHLFEQIGPSTKDYLLNVSRPHSSGPGGGSIQDINVSTFQSSTFRKTTIGLYEESLRGWDSDVSFLIPKLDQYVDLRLIAGLYGYQDGDTAKGFNGWRLGAEFRPIPSVVFMGSHFNDDRNDEGQWFAGVRFEIPFGSSTKDLLKVRRRSLEERLREPVSRRNAVTLADGTKVESRAEYTRRTRIAIESLNLGRVPHPGDWVQLADGTILVVDSDGRTLHFHGNGDPNYPITGVIAVVPEPARAILLTIGLMGLIVRRRR